MIRPGSVFGGAALSIAAPVAIIVSLGVIGWIETRQPVPYFRLVSLTLGFALLTIIAALLRGHIRDAAIALASLWFGLCAVEAAAYLFEQSDNLVVTDGWAVTKPVIGWGPLHEGRFHAKKTDAATGSTIYDVDYTIDSNLLRQTSSRIDGPTIVFFGDSFTFGFGLNDQDTLPQLFADVIGRSARVLNLGNGGYGPQQFLRELQTGFFDAVIGPQPRLFVFLTGAWHAERTACNLPWVRHAPRYVLEEGKLLFKGECHEGAALALRQWLEHSAAYRRFAEPFRHQIGAKDIELYIRILSAAVEFAKDKYGVPTLIPYLNVPPSYLAGSGFNNNSIIARLRNAGAFVTDVSLAEEEASGAEITIRGDGHPTPLANRLRASLLKTYVERHFPNVFGPGSDEARN